jgi:hypothetical protein
VCFGGASKRGIMIGGKTDALNSLPAIARLENNLLRE